MPVIVVEPMDSVTVHVPAAGKPLRATLPVANAHVGCVMTPIMGADWLFTVTATAKRNTDSHAPTVWLA